MRYNIYVYHSKCFQDVASLLHRASCIVKNAFTQRHKVFFFFFYWKYTCAHDHVTREREHARLFHHVFTVTFFLMTLVERVISDYCYALNIPINYLKGVF